MEPKLIVLVTGGSGAGKDYCTDVWVPMFISEATKHEYAYWTPNMAAVCSLSSVILRGVVGP